VDVAIVGAGAAGLATAIFIKRLNPSRRVTIFDGQRRPGAKILVSGGGRCNVTNVEATAADFNGGTPGAVATVLKALPVPATVAFFAELGVPLHEEPGGKLFPLSNRARDVLDALLREADRLGVELRSGDRVRSVDTQPPGFTVVSDHETARTSSLVIATGGLSLPRTGSDGWGYQLAAHLGHTIVPTTPALVPLVFGRSDEPRPGLRPPAEGRLAKADGRGYRSLAGVSQPVRLDLRVDGRVARRIAGSMLWTHQGISGPAALDISRHWLRADLERRPVSLTASLCPDEDFASLECAWLELARARPRLSLAGALSRFVPNAVAEAMLADRAAATAHTLATLGRADRRQLLHALLECPLPVVASRGYNFAEVTAGGVALSEVSPRTMESRIRPGLYFVGEVLDVDGRLGGFNFQ
jgi:hypothetical protein